MESDRFMRISYEEWANDREADVERDSEMETEMQDETARDAWRRWWDEEGSGERPLPNEDAEQFARRMTEIAWSNGAFKRLADVDRLRAELAAMREQRDEAHGLIQKWRLNLVDVVEVGDYMDAMTSEARISMNDADKRAFLEATRKEGGGADGK